MNEIQQILTHVTPAFKDEMSDVASRLFISLLIVGTILGLRSFILTISGQRGSFDESIARWKKHSKYVSFSLIVILVFPVWLPALQNALAILGIIGTGILIVLKEIFLNLVGWLYIVIRRPFEEGNRIQVFGKWGDVIDIRLIEFSMIEVMTLEEGGQSTGRVIHVPNMSVLTQIISNASKEFSFNWHELKIPITLESNWDKASTILLKIAESTLEKIREDDMRIRRSLIEHSIRYKILQPSVSMEFKKGTILLFLRYLVEPRNMRQTQDALWRAILSEFKKHRNITLSDNTDV